jgi:cysteine-rich repeat protein
MLTTRGSRMKKTILVLFVLCLASVFAAEAAVSCTVTTSCSENEIFRISDTTNGQAQLTGQSPSYSNIVCCNEAAGSELLLRLSAQTNAHVQDPSVNTYSYSVGLDNAVCGIVTSGTCADAGYETCVVSISDTDNAHVGNCSAYSNLVCCKSDQICGNSNLEYPEHCDDGGTVDGDGCSATCTSETADLWFDQVIITDEGDGTYTYAFLIGTVPRILINDNSGLIDLGSFQYEEQTVGGSDKILVSMSNLILTDTTKIITIPERNKYCAVDDNNFLSGSILGNWNCWTESGRITWELGVNPCVEGSQTCGKNATGSDVCQYKCEEIVVDLTTYGQLTGFTYTGVEAGEDILTPIPEFSNIIGVVILMAVIVVVFMLLKKNQ